MKLIVLQILAWLSFLILSFQVICQDTTFYNRFGFRAYSGSIFVHSEDVENTSGSRPLAYEFEYARRHQSESVWNLCRCYPTTGFVGGYTNYDNEILGWGAHLGYFVQYHFFQRTRITPTIRGLGGLSYNNRPHDPIANPNNLSYSLPINFVLQLSGAIEARLSEKITIDFALSFNHISNGGIRQPNKGINWPSYGFGLYYTPNFSPFTDRSNQVPARLNNRSWFVRANAYSSGHTKTFNDQKSHFMVYGIEALSGYYLTNLHTLMGGMEWNFDLARQEQVAVESLNVTPQRISLNIGHEFILGDFRFSQKIGGYLLDPIKNTGRFYHKWGMSYLHKSGIIGGIELKAHRHVAEIVTGTLGWQF
jgi:hypothetical protein